VLLRLGKGRKGEGLTSGRITAHRTSININSFYVQKKKKHNKRYHPASRKDWELLLIFIYSRNKSYPKLSKPQAVEQGCPGKRR
jgi:hypothetical protein